jgi:hypothetical protein
MGRLSESEIAVALDSGEEFERSEQLAHLADGELNFAKQLLEDQTSITSSISFFIRWMRACYGVQMEVIRDLCEEFHRLEGSSKKRF